MTYTYFSCNGEILPTSQAVVPLDNIEYAYGFGVYETIRVSGGVPYFLKQHCTRLLASAGIIDLEHSFTASFIEASVKKLIAKNNVQACNVKMVLLGGPTHVDAKIYIQCLAPLFPDRKLYTSGAHFITYVHERDFPGAKTLNMLPSYLAYRQAKQRGAYDALLVNHAGNITEGTRTNFMCIKGQTIISPPERQILPGIMRAAVLDFAEKNGFRLAYEDIGPKTLARYDGAFVTSASSKILSVKSVDDYVFGLPPANLRNLMREFGKHLDGLANSGKTQT